MSSIGHGLIGALMRLYPQDFRSRFGEGIAFALEEEHRAARARGVRSLAGFWITTVGNTLREGLRERVLRGSVRRSERAVDIDRRWERDGEEMIIQTIREFGLALRRMSKRPAFAVTGIVTLGLGIGAKWIISKAA